MMTGQRYNLLNKTKSRDDNDKIITIITRLNFYNLALDYYIEDVKLSLDPTYEFIQKFKRLAK